jgi:hypothetical protein
MSFERSRQLTDVTLTVELPLHEVVARAALSSLWTLAIFSSLH